MSSVKDETPSSLEPISEASLPARTTELSPITEEEVRTALRELAPATSQDLVSRFRPRLVTQEVGCLSFLVTCFRSWCILVHFKFHCSTLLIPISLPLGVQDLDSFYYLFLQDKKAFLNIVRKISHMFKNKGRSYLVLRQEHKWTDKLPQLYMAIVLCPIIATICIP